MMRQRCYPLVSSSHDEYVYDGEEIYCFCKKLASRKTSWSTSNPGRRYYGCPDFKKGGCVYFRWYDPCMCNRAKFLLNQLKESEQFLAKENAGLKMKIYNKGNSDNYEWEATVKSEEEVNSVRKVGSRPKYSYKKLFLCIWLCIFCFCMGLMFGSNGSPRKLALP